MPYFDSHAHLDIAAAGDPQIAAALLERAARAGVRAILVPAVAARDWQNLLDLAATLRICKGPEIRVALGIHPWAVLQASVSECTRDISRLRDHLINDRSTISGIGECGLDYAKGSSDADKRKQRDLFIRHLKLAELTKLPLSMHCVGAYGDLLELLRDFAPTLPPSVVHGFTGKAGLARQICSLGHYIGVGGAVTYPRFRHLREAIPSIPLDRLLIESDAPERSPLEYAPAPNEPSFIPAIAEEIARLRGCSTELVAEASTQNARRLFG